MTRKPQHPTSTARRNKKGSPVSRRPGQESKPKVGHTGPREEGISRIASHVESLLHEVLRFTQPADVIVSLYFRENKQLGHRERGQIAEATFAVLRRRMEFAQFAESGTGPAVRRLALLGLRATLGPELIKHHADPESVMWLERLTQIDRGILSPEVRSNLPEWLRSRLVAYLGEEETAALAEAWLKPAPLDVRVNLMRGRREEILETLKAQGAHWDADVTAYSPHGLRFKHKPALATSPLFLDGTIEVQDEGSQLLCQLLAPRRGEMIADFCAGAGGKTLALGALMRSTGRLYAFDVSERRLARLKPRLARSGLSNVHSVLIDSENDIKIKRLAGKMDRVLVDAPCSGLGTLRRNPDLKWRQSPESISELTQKQAAILTAAARLVKPGGRLVYATCSVLPEENSEIVNTFLAAHPEFSRINARQILLDHQIELPEEKISGDDLMLWPHKHQTDGFFAAVLERNKPESTESKN
jgi:16S rRNA (cytosine967-C5)-methyltransferase